MRALLFGSNGMLGQAIREKLRGTNDVELFCAARNDADFCMDFTDDTAVKECFDATCPDVVINAAAVVNLQKCEDDPSFAYLINARFCSILSELSRRHKSYLVQVSTDHYYTGDGKSKHRENDPIRLLNEYARTKYAGECFTLTYPLSVVIRTNIVGFRGVLERPTFLEWAIAAICNGESITAFSDFYTSSIHARQFANILTGILKLQPKGVYNLTSSEVLSKTEFLENLSQTLFQRKLNAKIGSVMDLQGIKRAESLGLDVSKSEKLLGLAMPTATEVMASIKEEYMRRVEADEI